MIVTLLAPLKDFWRNIVWRATKRSSSTSGHVLPRHQQSRESEVTDFDVHIPVQENIAHFQVPMYDTLRMHVFDATRHLDRIETNFRLRNEAPFLHHVHERPVWTKLKYDICALLEGESAMKLHDIRMPHFRMDLELCLELRNR